MMKINNRTYNKTFLVRKAIKQAIFYFVLSLYAIVTIFPLIWLLYTSLKTNNEVFMDPWALPRIPQFINYVFAWNKANMSIFMRNSLVVSAVCVVTSVSITCFAAYGIVRFKTKLSKAAYVYFIFGILVPGSTLLIPLYVLMSKLHLLNSIFTLILTYTVFAIPMSIFLFCAAFTTVPNELEEAGIIDGCNILQVFLIVVLPVIKPVIATVAIINFLGFWNEYIFALIFTSSDAIRTLPVGLANFRGMYTVNYARMAAGIVIAIIPSIAVFIAMQERVISGMTAGAVKG